ncbi:MAG: DNA internalization-related competence protein ComEC/Rec2, partial [Actinobacteria bacterium]|nr:DNA internalization-related competence protein ComEC/Rec2 [Actinomycetota bacterium]
MKPSPIFYLALSYIFGIILSNYLHLSINLILFLIFICLFFLLIRIFRGHEGISPLQPTTYNLRPTLPYLIFLLIGLLATNLSVGSLEKGVLKKFVNRGEVLVSGRITSEPAFKEKEVNFNLEVNQVKIKKTAWKTSEITRVRINNPERKLKAETGQNIKVKGNFTIPFSKSDSSFNYQEYLYRQKIQTIFDINEESLKIEGHSSLIFKMAGFARNRIREIVFKNLSGDKAGLLLGILIGDTSKISDDLKESFRKTGLTHILAVSGLNVGMLALVFLGFLKFLKVRKSSRIIWVILIITFYVFITGFQPSVVRAAIMAIIGFLGWTLGRQKDLLAAISASALLILIYDPFLVYSISFQLSFAATLAIIVLNPVLEEGIVGLPKNLKGNLTIALAAQLSVAPILIYYFNQLSLISLVANLLVVPATAPSLALGVASNVLSFISINLSAIFNWANGWFIAYMIGVTNWLANFPMASIFVDTPSKSGLMAYYFFLGGFTFLWSKKKKLVDIKNLIIVFLVFLTAFIWVQVIRSGPPDKLSVNFFDVGQADSALIQTPSGENILIDGGENEDIVQNKLALKGVSRIDLLILSHPHADHVGGLASVVKNYRIGLILDSGQPHTSSLYKKFLEAVKRKKIIYKLARKGQKFRIGSKLRLEILNPSENFISGTESDLNNNSIVVMFIYGSSKFLFPGDVENEAQRNLLDLKNELKSSVLKVPHHGSAKNNWEFLKAIRPKIAVISVGRGNSFGHPAKSTLNKLK